MIDPNWKPRLIDPETVKDVIQVPLLMDLDEESFLDEDSDFILFNESIPGLIREALGDKVDQAPAFTYLFRRFGLPNIPSFSHYELARYAISTPMPDMIMEISPGFSGNPDHSIRFMVPVENTDPLTKWPRREERGAVPPHRHKDWRNWPEDDPMKPYALAAEATLLDLLKPVSIASYAINLLGPVEITPSTELLSPATSSVHPLPLMANEKPRKLHLFHNVVTAFGEGDMSRGINKIVNLLPATLESSGE